MTQIPGTGRVRGLGRLSAGAVRALRPSAAAYLGASVATRGVSLLVGVAAARLLGAADFGTLVWAATLFSIITTVAEGGVNRLVLIRMTAPDQVPVETDELLGARLACHAAVGILVGLGVVVAAALGARALALGLVVQLAVLPVGVISAGGLVERAEGHLTLAALLDGWTSVAIWACPVVVSLWLGGLSVWGYLAFPAASAVVAALAAVLLPVRFRVPRRRSRTMIVRRARPFLVSSSAIAIYSRSDRIVVGMLAGATAVGLYGAAYSLINAGSLLGVAIDASLFVKLQAAVTAGPSSFRRVLSSALGWATGIGVVAVVLTVVLAPFVVTTLFGPAFEAAAPLLRALSPLLFFYVVNPLLAAAVVALGDHHLGKRIAVANLVAALVAYPLFTVWWGAMGAAVASVLLEAHGFVRLAVKLRAMVVTFAPPSPTAGLDEEPWVRGEVIDATPA